MRGLLLALGLCLVACDQDSFSIDDPAQSDELAARVESAPSQSSAPSVFGGVSSLQHAHLDVLLREYFGPGGERFQGLIKDGEARRLLADYKVVLAGARPEQMSNPSERLSFWINAYTALVIDGLIHLVERDGEAASIDADDFALFTRIKHKIAGFRVTLEEVEHLVLRGHRLYPDVRDTPVALADQLMDQHRLLFPSGRRDPRVNFAVSFGARSFPPIPAQAYTAAALETLLDERTRAFINDRDLGASERGVSVLFEWFRRDFVEDAGSVKAFIEPYLDDTDREIATDRSLRYDWGVR